MNANCCRWVVALSCAIALCSSPALATGSGDDPPIPHTLTWWCVDLNDLWNVDVPMILGRPYAVAPVPSPVPEPCGGTFPIVIPHGESFAPGGALWWFNHTYPRAIRDALAAMDYTFQSQSPAEDFMSKFAQIRAEVRTYPGNVLVSEHRFDPRKWFRLVRLRQWYGQRTPDPIVDPDLGINLSSEEVGRLPFLGFPVIIPQPDLPGEYRLWLYWTLSDWHNDGTCLDAICNVPAGEFLYANPRFTIVP